MHAELGIECMGEKKQMQPSKDPLWPAFFWKGHDRAYACNPGRPLSLFII